MSNKMAVSISHAEKPYPGSHLITFSGARYHSTTEQIVKLAPNLGVEKVSVYDDKWLIEKHPEFIEERKDLFYDDQLCDQSQKGQKIRQLRSWTRGFGWFCWKPFIILDALSKMKDGEIVLYIDADTVPIADLTPLFETCKAEGGVMLFAACGYLQRHWCKRDCMNMMFMDSDYWRDKQHAVARFMLFQKGASKWCHSRYGEQLFTPERFCEDWLTFASSVKCNTFDASTIEPEYPDLKQHRCEQAILTNLAHRYNIPLHREACDSGNLWIKA